VINHCAGDQNWSAWGEKGPHGTSGGFRGISGADWGLYGAVTAVALGIGIVNALSVAQDVVWRGGAYDARTPLLWEMSSVVTIILVATVLFVAVRRISRASGWPLRVGLAVAAIIAFSALHITGMVALRKIAMLTAGGSYDFHFSFATLIYEFRKAVITSLLTGGTIWLIDRRNDAHRSRLFVAAPPEDLASAPPVVWLRDGATRIRIEPSDILWVGSAGNYVEYRLADGRTHLVRGTLAAEEARLAKFSIVRVHRTRLVNLPRVIGVTASPSGDFTLTLDTGQAVPGSRRYRDAVASIEALATNPASTPSGSNAHP
jgi:hypothetical protein